ncbi:hypothetical protein QQF64_007369 [Cirrhinus molitorella]|uniref:Uncharacterized protein n=1 Tax=Cirrhinus molitorella TaxID=172907 RepID=A0ABR3MDL3_9TELE
MENGVRVYTFILLRNHTENKNPTERFYYEMLRCSVLQMGVERCNWALCRPPNCLTTNKRLWKIPVFKQYSTYQCFAGDSMFVLVPVILLEA